MNPFRIAVAALSAALLACSAQAVPTGAPTPFLAPATSSITLATGQPVGPVSPVQPATPTIPPFVPFTVSTWADNVVLHDNPGHLSTKLAVLLDNTPLTLLGRTPGGEWLMVKTADNRLGWVFDKLVETTGPETSTAPLVTPTGVMVVRGSLTDIGGRPVNGVQFSVVQAGVGNERRTDATTDAEGVFYAFLPADSQGSWWVSYTAISCESIVMDATCSNWTGEAVPKGTYVQLPGGAHSPLKFDWK